MTPGYWRDLASSELRVKLEQLGWSAAEVSWDEDWRSALEATP